MGFSGGGSNITKAHTHSSAIVQDGGALNFSNVTQAGMAAGDITYSNGTALQILNLGNASDTLAVNAGATAPEWAASAAAAGAYTFLQKETLGADTNSWTVTLDTAYQLADNGSLIIQLETLETSGAGSGTLSFTYNNETNNYYMMWQNQAIATVTNALQNSQAAIYVAANVGDECKINAQLQFFNNPLTENTNYNYNWNFSSYNPYFSEWRFGRAHREDTTPFTTEITEFNFSLDNGDLIADSIINIYVVTN